MIATGSRVQLCVHGGDWRESNSRMNTEQWVIRARKRRIGTKISENSKSRLSVNRPSNPPTLGQDPPHQAVQHDKDATGVSKAHDSASRKGRINYWEIPRPRQ